MLGGCVSAEHGIGKLKAKYLNAMMGERYLNEMADLKRAFDPKGILGRGNIFGGA
jgi:D-lactate dehydrogenase (cytochrome)